MQPFLKIMTLLLAEIVIFVMLSIANFEKISLPDIIRRFI
jgi:hypothetical protein